MSQTRDAWTAAILKKSKGHKYGAKQKVVDNITFDSTKEANRYVELKHLQSAGRIHALELQPRFSIAINDIPICTYVADFRYQVKDIDEGGFSGRWLVVVEDAKGMKTPEYRLKKKLVEAQYGIQIQEL